MPFITPDRVSENSTSTGTGNFTLTGVIGASFRTFAATMVLTDTTTYLIEAVDGSGNPTGQWETGIGTYSATGILTRTQPLDGSATLPVDFSAGAKRVSVVPSGATRRRTRISVFTQPGGSLALLPDSLALEYILIGAGGSGATGRRGATNLLRGGGGGGGGGGMTRGFLQRSMITENLIVNVGAAATARATSPTSNDTSGQSGIAGGDTFVEHGGVVLALAGGGRGGAPGTNSSNGGAGGAGGSGSDLGGAGGTTSINTSAPIVGGPGAAGGGGAGASVNTANNAGAAGSGGVGAAGANGGTAPSAGSGGSGGNASAPPSGVWLGGSGGSGGASQVSGAGGAGGDGSFPGGGGGGAAGCINGFTSGDGGLGADGLAIIIEHL